MNFKYRIWEPDIKCPYCDKDCYDDEHESASNLEVKIEMECEHCEKNFYVVSSINYCTYSDCELNNERHVLKGGENVLSLLQCNNCYHFELKDI